MRLYNAKKQKKQKLNSKKQQTKITIQKVQY